MRVVVAVATVLLVGSSTAFADHGNIPGIPPCMRPACHTGSCHPIPPCVVATPTPCPTVTPVSTVAPTPTPSVNTSTRGIKFTCAAAGLGPAGVFARQIKNTIRSNALEKGVTLGEGAITIAVKDVDRPVIYVDRSIAEGDLPITIGLAPLSLRADQARIDYEDPTRAGCTVKREFTVTVRHKGQRSVSKFIASAPGTFMNLQ